MSEHLQSRSSVGSRGSAPPSHHQHHQQQQHATPYPRSHGNPDPLASVWIRRLHLTPNPPPPPPHTSFAPPPLHEHDAVSNRSAGFGPFRWSPRPLRHAPVAAPAHGGGPPMVSPFFSAQPPPMPAVADIGEFAPVRTAIGFGGSSGGAGGFHGLSSRAILEVNPHAAWLATPAAGSAYQNHAVDMVPIRNSHDLHVRQHGMIPRNIPRRAPPSFSSPDDEPFSYWNMGRFQRSTTTSSVSQVATTPDNFVKKRNADSNGFLPLKFRKLSRAG